MEARERERAAISKASPPSGISLSGEEGENNECLRTCEMREDDDDDED